MTREVDEFLRSRFLLYRESRSVTPTAGGYEHIAAPIWEVANLVPPASVRRIAAGVDELGSFGGVITDCQVRYAFPSAERFWAARAGWVVGTWEEVVADLRTRPYGAWAYYAITEPEIDLGERAKVRISIFCALPVSATDSAVAQSAATRLMLGFLQEAASNADASIMQLTEVPNFHSRLKTESRVVNEVLAVLGKLEFSMNYKTSERYAMQV